MLPIDSPCTKVCTLHPRVPVCTGCGRNLSEIERWATLSRDELLTWIVMRATLDAGVDRHALVESLRAREELCSTALVKDAAFPHPNEPSHFGFARKRILVAVPREPVSFNDPHGHRPRVVVVVLARTVQGYLLTISRAVKLFGNPALIGRLTKSGDADEVIAAIREAEERLTASVSR